MNGSQLPMKDETEQTPDEVANVAIISDATDQNFDQYVELSKRVPIILDMWAPWCGPCRQLGPLLEKAVTEAGGRVGLAKVNVDENPAVAQAFRVQGIPAVFLLLGGSPAPLFTGAIPAAQVAQVVTKVVDLAAEQGITGTLQGAGVGSTTPQAAEEPSEAAEIEAAREAIENQEWAQALEICENYLRDNPAESSKVEPLVARAQLGMRSAKAQVKPEATANDVAAQLDLADAEMNNDEYVVAMNRLLTLVSETEGEERDAVRRRLVEYFMLLGDNPAVTQARQRLATLLY